MNRSKALQLLGLEKNASESEIRRQYKKLALKLHPDVNPDPKAHEAFIQLTLAVEVLLKQTEEPTQISRSRRTAGSNTEEEQKERIRKAKERYEQQKQHKINENNRYFNSLTSGKRWSIYKWIMRVSLVLALCMSAELILPHHFEKDELIGSSKASNEGILANNITTIQLKQRGNYYVNFNRGIWSMCYPDVVIETTWFLHTPLYMYNHDDFNYYPTQFDFHSGSIHYGLIVFLLIPTATYFYRRKNLYFVFLYQFSFWFVGLTCLYLLITHERLIHLLCLGFI